MIPALSNDRTTSSQAILGVLSLHPMTGYEIRQQITRSIGNFWTESFGQIYPTLKRLKQEGLVDVAPAKSSRKVYTLTADGRKHLESWLPVMPRPRVPRNEQLLKLFFGALIPSGSMRAQVLETRKRYAADLLRYEKIVTDVTRRAAGDPNLPFWLMTLSYGRTEARAIVSWCDETVAALDELATAQVAKTKRKKVA